MVEDEKGAAKEPEQEKGYFRRGEKHEMRREESVKEKGKESQG